MVQHTCTGKKGNGATWIQPLMNFSALDWTNKCMYSCMLCQRHPTQLDTAQHCPLNSFWNKESGMARLTQTYPYSMNNKA